MEESQNELESITKYFTDFTPEQLAQLAGLKALYAEWNAQINVISRKDIDSLYVKHVLHSLSLASVFDFPDGYHTIDIGTGGGFPGIPLAILFPKATFHLVDSIGKKLKVVEAVAAGIGLKNVTTQHIRAEEIRGVKFDCAVSRAVAPIGELWFWARPLIKKNPPLRQLHTGELPAATGLICLKGGDLTQEIADSGTRPKIRDIHLLFPEPVFEEKYILQVGG